MWATLLLPMSLLAQDLSLLDIHRTNPAAFKSAGPEAQPPAAADRKSVERFANDWIKSRATSKKWKGGGFEFIGELTGRPADELKGGRYSVYRMKFKSSPDIGRALQTDMLFYGQGGELIWPPESWDRTKPPPGQMMAAVRNKIKE